MSFEGIIVGAAVFLIIGICHPIVIITDHNYDAISSVADNLFVIADGYTNQVRSREDLVRYGYLRAE